MDHEQGVMEALAEAAAEPLTAKLRAMEQQIQEAAVADQTLHRKQEEQAALVLWLLKLRLVLAWALIAVEMEITLPKLISLLQIRYLIARRITFVR